jgi:pyruvate/2-oxoglutarate dehydrogenase complex dihydrolipoamide acyltransferase (E2) component
MIAAMPETRAIVAIAVEGDPSTTAYVELYYVELGAEVRSCDPVALLRTDHYVYDLPAGGDGVVRAFLVDAGEAVELGAPLVRLEPPEAVVEPPEVADPPRAAVRRATPLARRMAATHGYALEAIAGTGQGGLIRAADVRGLVPAPVLSAVEPASAHRMNAQRAPVSDITKRAEARWSECKTSLPTEVLQAGPLAPLRDFSVAAGTLEDSVETGWDASVPRALTAFEVDLETIFDVGAPEAGRPRRLGVELTPMVRIAAAAVRALLEQRLLNSRWTSDGILLYGAVRLGLWSETERCRVRAVIPHAAELNARGLAKAIAKAGSPPPRGEPTFAIVDASRTGAMWRQPELPVECGAILGIGAIRPRVVVASSDGAALAVRRRCVLTLAYDVRYLLHSDADRYLARVQQLVEARHGM